MGENIGLVRYWEEEGVSSERSSSIGSTGDFSAPSETWIMSARIGDASHFTIKGEQTHNTNGYSPNYLGC